MSLLGTSLFLWRQLQVRLGRYLDERGQPLLEYLILAAVIAVIVIVGVDAFAEAARDWFNNVAAWIRGGASAPAGPSF